MRAVRTGLAGNPTIGAHPVLACKARDAVVGVIATRTGAKAAPDGQIAFVGWIGAIVVVLAPAAARDETARKVIAARREADFTDGACVARIRVAERVGVWARWAKRAGGAP